ncbi:hypothetical protein BJ170DRAFT_692435 [Xylariales sp. AK1849]|nr:hypothetical protein BJ170DRAFT_692435 [Xylariales sp. AK1849]
MAAAPTVTVTVSGVPAGVSTVYSTISTQVTSVAIVSVTATQSITFTVESTTTEQLTSSSTVLTTATEPATTTTSATVKSTETATPVQLLAIAAEETGYVAVSSSLDVYVEDVYTADTKWLFDGEDQYPYVQGGRDGAAQYMAYSEGINGGMLQLWTSDEIAANQLVQPVCSQSVDDDRNILLSCQDPETAAINKFASCTADDGTSSMLLVETVPSECTEITEIIVGGVRTRFVARTDTETGYLTPSVDSVHNITLSDAMTTDWKLDEETGEIYGIIDDAKVYWYMSTNLGENKGDKVLWYSEATTLPWYSKLSCSATTLESGESAVTCAHPTVSTVNVLSHCVDPQYHREYLALYSEDAIPTWCEKITLLQTASA